MLPFFIVWIYGIFLIVYNDGTVDATIIIPENYNPFTLDNIGTYMILALISSLGIAVTVLLNKKINKAN